MERRGLQLDERGELCGSDRGSRRGVDYFSLQYSHRSRGTDNDLRRWFSSQRFRNIVRLPFLSELSSCLLFSRIVPPYSLPPPSHPPQQTPTNQPSSEAPSQEVLSSLLFSSLQRQRQPDAVLLNTGSSSVLGKRVLKKLWWTRFGNGSL